LNTYGLTLTPYQSFLFNPLGIDTFGIGKLNNFYQKNFKDESVGGNYFGMSASSLMLYNNGINNAYSYNLASSVPSNWITLTPFIIIPSPSNIRVWISSYQPLEHDLACLNDLKNYKGVETVYNTLNGHISNGQYDMFLNIYGHAWSDIDNKDQPVIHTVVPYKIDNSISNQVKIYVYDYNSPNVFDRILTIDSTSYPWKVLDYPTINTDTIHDIYDLALVSFQSIANPPILPLWWTDGIGPIQLCFTDCYGDILGCDINGVFYNNIPGTCPMMSSHDNGNNSNSRESYYVPDPSIKMELYGNGSGSSQISMGNPNGLIVANVTVTPNSVDEFKIFNSGTGVYFNSENDTTQSLCLMLNIETPDHMQIVNASLSKIEKGGYVNLSNDNGTITLQNNGLPRTCDLSIQQVTSTQNSSINLTNIVIEANSTVNIVPSNWNDIANSTVTIEDVGSNGQVYYTEIITYKNGQVTQITYPGAALTIQKSAYPTSYDSVGQTITYSYQITNSGNVDISAPITVTDDKAGTVPIQNSGTLRPGSSVTGTATYKITDADINTGSVTNLASATGSFNNQPII
jgi:uncharacterized repeat protein (TIGR01451 family)